ncbi:hypothetical protein MG293_008311 [Ovis ammon polii]|uniref:Uncharacterized protein n=1 Tax=Ovis ammon polii TaxID=230172 RepID=A0AAD4UAR8_OVIAM|nr:hypothetical protein MG293_008311 [Ovis ammon polii]
MECGEAMGTGAPLGQGPSAPAALADSPQARLTVVVELERTRSGPKETCLPTLRLEGAKSIRLLQPEPLECQERCITFDRVLGSDAAQEAEQELLARVRPTLASVGRGYSVALLLRGRETEAPRLVPQLSANRRIRDLLTPGAGNLSVLDVAPLGLVVENASEVEVSDSRAASELYLRAACGEGRSCSLLTVTMSCLAPDPSEGPGNQGMWQGALRILQLPGEVLMRRIKSMVAGRTASIGPDLHQMHPLRDSEEQAQRHRLREQHQAWIQEEVKHTEQEEEVVAGDQAKGLLAEEDSKERQRWHREQTVLRCQLEALQAERDAAEQDLTALYDLHVQAARAQTCHVLQVFRAWQGLCEEQAMTTEHHYRSLLAGILQDSISLATQNQELQAQNKQLQQTGLAEVVLDTCPEEKSGDQESNRGTFFSPHL